MNAFKYLNKYKVSVVELTAILKGLENYAKTIYKGKKYWQDALDDTFFHVLENFDPEKGELENYVKVVLKRINLSYKENSNDDILWDALDKKEMENWDSLEGVEVRSDYAKYLEELKAESVLDCIEDIKSRFLDDFRFFYNNSTKKTCDYSDIFKKYNAGTITEAMDTLKSRCKGDFDELLSVKTPPKMFVKIDEKVDKDFKVQWVSGDFISLTHKSKKAKSVKVYRVDKEKVISILESRIYNGVCSRCKEIEGTKMYLTLSGDVVKRDKMEQELVKSFLKVLHRQTDMCFLGDLKGDSFYLFAPVTNRVRFVEYWGFVIDVNNILEDMVTRVGKEVIVC